MLKNYQNSIENTQQKLMMYLMKMLNMVVVVVAYKQNAGRDFLFSLDEPRQFFPSQVDGVNLGSGYPR